MAMTQSVVITEVDEIPTDEAAGRRRKQHKRVGTLDGELNLTSMIDVIFQLLVYFLLTITFVVDEGSLQAVLPGATGNPVDDRGQEYRLVLSPLDAQGAQVQLTLAGMQVTDFSALQQLLIERRRDADNPAGLMDPAQDALIIDAQPGVRWNHVVDAFNQCLASGYQRVNFAQIH